MVASNIEGIRIEDMLVRKVAWFLSRRVRRGLIEGSHLSRLTDYVFHIIAYYPRSWVPNFALTEDFRALNEMLNKTPDELDTILETDPVKFDAGLVKKYIERLVLLSKEKTLSVQARETILNRCAAILSFLLGKHDYLSTHGIEHPFGLLISAGVTPEWLASLDTSSFTGREDIELCLKVWLLLRDDQKKWMVKHRKVTRLFERKKQIMVGIDPLYLKYLSLMWEESETDHACKKPDNYNHQIEQVITKPSPTLTDSSPKGRLEIPAKPNYAERLDRLERLIGDTTDKWVMELNPKRNRAAARIGLFLIEVVGLDENHCLTHIVSLFWIKAHWSEFMDSPNGTQLVNRDLASSIRVLLKGSLLEDLSESLDTFPLVFRLLRIAAKSEGDVTDQLGKKVGALLLTQMKEVNAQTFNASETAEA
jgi:hypothetical protein